MAQDLPLEILGEIFVFCLPKPDINDVSNTQPNTNIPPLLLCHVCRSWRRAAFGTPHLWCELTIALHPMSFESYPDSGLFKTIELWTSCRGVLPPSLHFRGDRSLDSFIPFKPIFEHSAISNAEALTLSNLSLRDCKMISSLLQRLMFSNLQFLSVTQPWGNEFKVAQFPIASCPNLRRLHFECDTQRSPTSKIVTYFCWRTLTHFRAVLILQLSDWYNILEQCVNLSSGIFSLTLTSRKILGNNRKVVHHDKLKMLSISGPPWDLRAAFDGFVFPSATSLRISSGQSVETIHALLNTTPALKELHLHNYQPFALSSFLQPQKPSLTGPLSKFVPQLQALVIDLGRYVRTADLHALLHSGWLNDGWSQFSTRKSIEFFLSNDSFGNLFTNHIDPSVSLNFHISSRRIWGDDQKVQPTAVDLRDRWEDLYTFYV